MPHYNINYTKTRVQSSIEIAVGNIVQDFAVTRKIKVCDQCRLPLDCMLKPAKKVRRHAACTATKNTDRTVEQPVELAVKCKCSLRQSSRLTTRMQIFKLHDSRFLQCMRANERKPRRKGLSGHGASFIAACARRAPISAL